MRLISLLAVATPFIAVHATPASRNMATVDYTISHIALINNSTQRFVHFLFSFVQLGHESDPITSWSQLANLDSGESRVFSTNWQDGTLLRFSINGVASTQSSGPLFQTSLASTCTATYLATAPYFAGVQFPLQQQRSRMFKLLAIILVALATHAAAHAVVTTPTPRQFGPAAQEACGAAVYKSLTSDLTGPIEFSVRKIDTTYNADACHIWFCRGAQYEDNVENTRVYEAGTVVPMKIDLVAHHTGYANVSVVDLAAQVPIARLFTWPVYANDSLGPSKWPKNETEFEVTIPDLGSKCTQAGACAIQWWWYATGGQTYESCIDFTQ
ncbi:chitin binding [Moniliophthora roreri MCA 2997]|uniref:Chitin binding n=1 Tax=Moniliophthora roreri (strain MCA 2997) TaxID=1381753 RepID=V2XD73_MONRO|nr:chitin binding [Moniliophthora roreri MCA 2997]